MLNTNKPSMNEYGQQAILSTHDHIYYYYQLDYETSFRIDDEGETASNPYYEYDILTQDLMEADKDIEYIAPLILEYLLHDDDLRECFDEKALAKIEQYELNELAKHGKG